MAERTFQRLAQATGCRLTPISGDFVAGRSTVESQRGYARDQPKLHLKILFDG